MVQSAHCSSTPIMPGFRGVRGKGEGANQDVAKLQPMSYISAEAPPLYFIHGTTDTKAPVKYVDEYVDAPELIDRAGDQRVHLRGVRHVGRPHE